MDIKDLRGLMEAYSEVYAPQEVDEATAMAKRGYDEAPIRQKIAKSTGGGEAADRATALEKKSTFGDAKKAKQRQDLARKQRGDFRKTTSSSPGLHGYAHKSDDPKVKAKQAARGAQRGALTPAEKKQLNREEFDIFDVVLEFLYVEGYAETLEEAEWMMANLIDEEAVDIILEAMDEDEEEMKKGKKSKKEEDDEDEDEEELDEALTGDRYRAALKKGKMYSRKVSADPAKRAKRGGRGGESDFGAGDRGAGNKAARRAGTYREYNVNEASRRDEFTRAAIARNSGRKGGITFEPGPNWDPSANRGKGAHLSPKQKEKQRRKALRQEEFELWVNELVEEGYDLSDYTWDEMYDIYEAEKPFPYEKVTAQQKKHTAAGRYGNMMKMGLAKRRAKEAEKTGGSQRDAGKGWYHAKEAFEAWLDEAMTNYEKNRKRAAQRAAARNAARDAGKTGAVPGVGYVTPRRERETWTDESGKTRHAKGL